MSSNNKRNRGKVIKFVRTHFDAIKPTKASERDSGYDLNLVELIKTDGMVEYYRTGVKLELPKHEHEDLIYYFGLYARSSLVKTGYMIANSVGILDEGYRGEPIAALIKFDPKAPKLELPAKVVQVVIHTTTHMEVEIVDKLSTTKRGCGGFGSTNK